MPFIGRPDGFSSETLAMLDMAMSQLWLEQAAIFVSSATPPANLQLPQPAAPAVTTEMTTSAARK